MKKVFSYTVAGMGKFPFDMLRYDQAWPASESESYALAERTKRSIKIQGMRRPTTKRWQSFGWTVNE